MKSKLLLVVCITALSIACKKNDKQDTGSPKDFLQLQEVEHETGKFILLYDARNQPSKVEQKETTEAGFDLYQYTNFTWSDGLIRTAALYQRYNGNFFRRTELKYHYDAKKRISPEPVLTAVYHKILDENNQPVYSGQNSYTTSLTYTYDTNGGLKKASVNTEFERRENGTVVDGFTEETEWRLICMKKP